MSDTPPLDQLFLWWLATPAHARLVGTLRTVRRTALHPGGVALQYAPEWIAKGLALSEDLPLRPGEFLPTENNAAVGAVDDARPDRWGERIIRYLYRPPRLSIMEYLYFAGDNRFGALGVSSSASSYLPHRHGPLPSIGDVPAIHSLIRAVEAGETISEPLRRLIAPGATLGGARPKGALLIGGEEWIVKFSEYSDPLDSPLIEHATMTLARQAGIEVCDTMTIPVGKAHAIAIRRFDRQGSEENRRHCLSAHVALRAAGEENGYPELALLLRRRGEPADFRQQGEQLFRRMIFNILIDNTDDHEKNHVLIVNANQRVCLSPAFDVLPTGQALGYQQMRVGSKGADSSLENALSEHRSFGLKEAEAIALSREVSKTVANWRAHFSAQGVSSRDIDQLARQIDRPFLLEQRK